MSCKYTLGNIRGPHGLSILRVGEGEFDGEFDGNSREFDAGFGEFDVFSMLAELWILALGQGGAG